MGIRAGFVLVVWRPFFWIAAEVVQRLLCHRAARRPRPLAQAEFIGPRARRGHRLPAPAPRSPQTVPDPGCTVCGRIE